MEPEKMENINYKQSKRGNIERERERELNDSWLTVIALVRPPLTLQTWHWLSCQPPEISKQMDFNQSAQTTPLTRYGGWWIVGWWMANGGWYPTDHQYDLVLDVLGEEG